MLLERILSFIGHKHLGSLSIDGVFLRGLENVGGKRLGLLLGI